MKLIAASVLVLAIAVILAAVLMRPHQHRPSDCKTFDSRAACQQH